MSEHVIATYELFFQMALTRQCTGQKNLAVSAACERQR